MTIEGVHLYKPDEALFRETLEIQWGADLTGADLKRAEANVRDHFSNLYLVEVAFRGGIPEDFDWGAITQEIPNLARDNWQVPWDEQQVNTDAERWVFFFHFLDVSQPLITSSGTLELPKPTPLPKRLAYIPYEAPG